jgi:hypothetical protein
MSSITAAGSLVSRFQVMKTLSDVAPQATAARDAAAARNGDVDSGLGGHEQVVERAGALVAQHRQRSHRKDGGHQVAVRGKDAVAERVDAAVQSDQVARGKAAIDLVSAESRRQQLPASHDPCGGSASVPMTPSFPRIRGVSRGDWRGTPGTEPAPQENCDVCAT